MEDARRLEEARPRDEPRRGLQAVLAGERRKLVGRDEERDRVDQREAALDHEAGDRVVRCVERGHT
jgi:hypothetical protein